MSDDGHRIAVPAHLIAALADRYAIEREIGRGGMATVYLARDLKHDRQVAVKVLDPDLGAVLGAERFLSEIRVTANLQHPNLLPLFDSGSANGLLYYVMPFVEGESLRHRLDRERQLPVEEAVRLSVAVARALDYAHGHGVIHRDLKPENILLQHGQPVVADFGIALAVSNAGGQRVTQTGLSLGTPMYMSPEQATGDRVIDRRTDIYSLGAVTYEMLAGEPPHVGATSQAIISRLLTEKPRSLVAVRPTVPDHVDEAVQCALEKLPADRFASAGEFADALGGARRMSSLARTRAAAPATRTTRALRVVPWVVAAASLALAVVQGRRRPAPASVEQYDLTGLAVQRAGRSPMSYVGTTLALSRDGSRIAFVVHDGSGPARVWVRDLRDLTPRPVSGTEGAESVTLSPDGQEVAFITGRSLRRVAATGGSPSTLVTDGARRPAWGDDGMIYFGSTSASGAGEGISRIPATGGKAELLTAPMVGKDVLRDPSPLAGGTALLVTKVGNPNTISIVSLPAGRVRDLVVGHRPRYVDPGYLVYLDGPNFSVPGHLVAAPFDNGRLVLTGPPVPVVELGANNSDNVSQYAVAGTGALLYMTGALRPAELAWVQRNGVARSVDSTFHVTVGFPALSPDGSRVAVMTDGAIWVKTLDRGPALNLTLRGGMYPAWTPDGRSVSYTVVDSSSGLHLQLKPADGSAQATPLLANVPDIFEALWSADSRWQVLRRMARTTGAGSIFAVRPGMDSVPVPLLAGKSNQVQPALSPDGRWLAYASDETGRFEVYVVPFPNTTAARWVVSKGGGNEPAWSPRGDELFYRDGNDNMVSAVIQPGRSFVTGHTTVLFSADDYNRSEWRRQYEVAHDGQSFLMMRQLPGGPSSKVVLVKNWLADLRRPGARPR